MAICYALFFRRSDIGVRFTRRAVFGRFGDGSGKTRRQRQLVGHPDKESVQLPGSPGRQLGTVRRRASYEQSRSKEEPFSGTCSQFVLRASMEAGWMCLILHDDNA